MMKRIFFIAILFFSISFCGGQTLSAQRTDLPSGTVTMYYLEGVKKFLQGDSEGSVKIFSMLNGAVAGGYAPALFYLSRISFQQRDLAKSEEYIEQAIKIDSLNIDYLQLGASLFSQTRKLDKAIEVYERILDIDTTDSEPRVMLAILSYLSGDVESSLAQIDSLEKMYGFDDRLYSLKREYYIEKGLIDELEGYTKRVLSANPDDYVKLIHTAQIGASRGRDSLALVYYNRALEAAGGASEPYIALLDYYKVRRNVDGMEKMLDVVFELEDVVGSYKAESFLYLLQNVDREVVKSGKYDYLSKKMLDGELSDSAVVRLYLDYLLYKQSSSEALAFLESIEGSFDVNEAILYLQLLYQTQQAERATQFAYGYTKRFPQSVELAGLSAHLFSLKKDNKRALEVLSAAIKSVKSDSLLSAAYGARGDFYYTLKKKKSYYSDYKKALEYNPNNAIVLNNLAYFMALDGGDLSQALTYAKRANELSEQNPTYLDTQAWVNFLMGRYDEAKRLMQLVFAYERNPSFDMYLHYGDILYALGDDFLARENWRKALKAGGDEKEINERLARPKAVK